jgi:hypothetical protein
MRENSTHPDLDRTRKAVSVTLLPFHQSSFRCDPERIGKAF